MRKADDHPWKKGQRPRLRYIGLALDEVLEEVEHPLDADGTVGGQEVARLPQDVDARLREVLTGKRD